LKPASLKNSSRISWISNASDTKRSLITLLIYFAKGNPFVNLLIQVYKGTSTGGGVIQEKGLVGTQGVQMKVASPGCVRNKSSVCVFLSTTKILSVVKCSQPQRVAIRLSKKSYATRGTRAPSKCSSQSGGNCPKMNLIESTKDDSRYPKGKEAEWGCLPTLAQRLTEGRGPLDLTQTL